MYKKILFLILIFNLTCFLLFEPSIVFSHLLKNNDGTITDSNSCLIWQHKRPNKEMTWMEALNYCENLNLANKSDWRLPSIAELYSLIYYCPNDYEPPFNIEETPENLFFGIYWSSTTIALTNAGTHAWGVDHSYRSLDIISKSSSKYVRAVRGGKCEILQNVIPETQSEFFFQLGHSSCVRSVCFSPDGKYIISGSNDATVKLWEPNTGKVARTLIGNTFVISVSVSPNSRYIASSSFKTINLWDVSTGKLISTFKGHSNYIQSVSFSPDSRFIVSGSSDKTIKLWDVRSGKLISTFYGHGDDVYSVTLSNNGLHIASGSRDKTIKLWEIQTGKIISTLKGHSESVNSVSFSPDGYHIASGSSDKSIKIWDVSSGKLISTLHGHDSSVNSVAFSYNGLRIVSGSRDTSIKLWDVRSGKLISTFKGHNESVNSVNFSPNARCIVSGSSDKTIKTWEITTENLISTFQGYRNSIYSLSFSPDGRLIASGNMDKTIKLWKVSTGKLVSTFQGHTGWVRSVSFSPDGNRIASGSDDNTIKLWDVTTGKLITTFQGHDDDVVSVAFSPNGRFIASGSDDDTFKLWEVPTGKLVHTFEGHSDTVKQVCFSPDGRFIASGSYRTIKIWEVPTDNSISIFKFWEEPTFKLIASFQNHNSYVYSVNLSSDGRFIASRSFEKTVKIWEVPTGKLISTIQDHGSSVCLLSFSPDGRFIASGNSDKNIKIWDVYTGKLISKSQGLSNFVSSVSFSPGGCRIASGISNKIRMWDVKTGQPTHIIHLLPNNEWITTRLNSIYEASANGVQYAAVRLNSNSNDWKPLSQFSPIPTSHIFKPKEPEQLTKNFQETSTYHGIPVPTIQRELKKLGYNVGPIDGRVGPMTSKAIKSFQRDCGFQVDGKATIDLLAKIRLTVSKKFGVHKKNIVYPANKKIISSQKEKIKKDITPPEIHLKRGIKIVSNARKLIEGRAIDESGVAIVEINGKESQLDEKGYFVSTILLKPGINQVDITAIDIYSNKATKKYTIERSYDTFDHILGEKGVKIGKYFALLIAVENYQSSTVNDLNYPVKDAYQIKDVLKYYIFEPENIIFLKNPTRDTIINKFDQLSQKITQNDNLLIFYAGHGYWDKKFNQGYWLPSNASRHSRSKWLSNSTIRDYIRGIQTKHTLLVSDACFSGAIFKTRMAFYDAAPATKELYKLPSRKAMTSGTLTEVPDKSVFIEFFVKRLKNNECKYLSSEQLFIKLKDAVINNSPLRQVPQFGEIQEAGDEGGTFIFVRRKI